jgi:hypothetical protein
MENLLCVLEIGNSLNLLNFFKHGPFANLCALSEHTSIEILFCCLLQINDLKLGFKDINSMM